MSARAEKILGGTDALLPDLGALYRDLHANPELSFAEHRTAAEVARRLTGLGLDVTSGVGGTGVVGVLRNGDGPTVLLRADFDALPVREETGLPYASTATATDADGHEVGVMHACGHDMHVTCLLGALTLLTQARDDWHGTVVAVFQPAEEIGGGARAMLDDGFLDRFPHPDVALGQHVWPGPVGTAQYRGGPTMAAADSLRVRLHGRGGHGSRPEATIDPVVMAASTVLRLQTVVSREVAAGETVVLTVGSIRAGAKSNIIPAEAELRLNVRTYDEAVRERVLAAIDRIVKAESAASDAPKDPEIEPYDVFPLTVNDEAATERVAAALRDTLGAENTIESDPVMGSEDFGLFGRDAQVPSVFWFFGGMDPQRYADAKARGRVTQEIPSNHSPFFAPEPEPTIVSGIRCMTTVALDWLAD
ncbi:MAG TPA: amidohydrolase [Streptosporangiaceae bacterium]|jgi:hippurate hydrolase